jgi:hypothetical protein
MMNDINSLCYINEQTSYPEDYNGKFGYTCHDKGNRFYLIFEAILQSFGVMNRNMRMYLAENIWDKIQNDMYIQTMLKQNSWVGEADHPNPITEGEKLSMSRISNPDPKQSSHYIRKPRLNGNYLEATIQTDSSNENGMNMAIKIVDGKIIPAFSARVLGALDRTARQPTVMVKKLITYDWVLFPSHADALAKIDQPIQESVEAIEGATSTKFIPFKELAQMAANDSKETAWLCESFGLSMDSVIGIMSDGSTVVQDHKNLYVQPLSNKIIKKKTLSILNEWMNQ